MLRTDIDRKQSVREITANREWLRDFGLLPAFYIGTSFFNFVIGATFGLLMALSVQMWGTLSMLHAELNPYGWLTILIYGMTYAVLKWFANIESPWPWLAWIQLLVAESGVWAVTVGFSLSSLGVLRTGLVLQALAPILFLINILGAVSAKRKNTKQRMPRQITELLDIKELAGSGLRLTDSVRRMYTMLGNSTVRFDTDSIAQRGTDLSLMLFIIASIWIAFTSFFAPSFSSFAFPQGATILVYYGWIAGTVLSVSLHLYQRYAKSPCLHQRKVQVGQGLWICGLGLSVLGVTFVQSIESIGSIVMGIGFLWIGIIYTSSLNRAFPQLKHPVHVAWKLSTICLLLLGGGLVFGMPLIDLPMFHLLFLGWITTLIYGVGYTFFPLLLRRNPRFHGLAVLQVWLSFIGVLFMVSGFYCMEKGLLLNASALILAAGGTCTVVSVLYFLLQWPFGKKTGDI